VGHTCVGVVQALTPLVGGVSGGLVPQLVRFFGEHLDPHFVFLEVPVHVDDRHLGLHVELDVVRAHDHMHVADRTLGVLLAERHFAAEHGHVYQASDQLLPLRVTLARLRVPQLDRLARGKPWLSLHPFAEHPPLDTAGESADFDQVALDLVIHPVHGQARSVVLLLEVVGE
jgi:hypothetical protein